MNAPRRQSLGRRFSLLLAGVITSILVMLSGLVIISEVSSLERRLRQRLDDALQLSQRVLPGALWQFNHQFVKDFADSLFLFQEVVFVQVQGVDTPIKTNIRREIDGHGFDYLRASPNHITAESEIRYGGERVGAIRLAVTRRDIRKTILEQSALSIALMAVLVTAVWYATLTFTRRHIFDRLAELEEKTAEIASGDLAAPIDVSGHDEISQLAGSFQNMMARLKAMTASRDELDREVLERKRAEADLREHQVRLLLALDAARAGTWVWDMEADRGHWDPRTHEIFGLAPGAFPGTREAWIALIHPEDRPRVEATIRRALAAETGRLDFHLRARGEGGRWRTIQVRGMVHADAQGGKRLMGLCADITQSMQAEEARRESDRRYRQLFESMLTGFALHEIIPDETGTGVDYRFLEVNRTFEELTGLKADAVVGRTLSEILPGADPFWADAYGRVAQTGESTSFQQHVPELGRHYEVMAYRPKAGQFATVFMDVTQRKQAEEALKESEERFRQMAENVHEVFYLRDLREGRILYVSPAFRTIWGLEPETLYHDPDAWLRPIHPEDREAASSLIGNLSGEEAQVEYRLAATGDGSRWILDRVFPIRDDTGFVFRLVGIATDITERILAEQERRLLEERLSQAQKMEAIGVLAGGIAHDFNNVLGAIIGYAELANLEIAAGEVGEVPGGAPGQTAGGGPGSAPVRGILRAGFRGRDLVRQLLTFSRKGSQERETLPLAPLVAEILKLMRATLPTTVEIHTDLGARGEAVLADPTQIHQVVMNLCANGAQAMRDSGGVLEILLESVALDREGAKRLRIEPGRYLVLSVRDSGVGMSPETLDRIFEPFFTTKEHGTGMGLAVAHGIVTGCRGAIDVESAPGAGSLFRVFLPQVVAGATARNDAEREADPGGRGRILFVDDEPPLLEVTPRILESLGYQVTALGSPQEALARFEADPAAFDLLVTDQTMPGMTGSTLADRIRTLKPGFPVVICTGYSDLISPEKAREFGFSGFLQKPVTRNEWALTLTRVLGGGGG